MEPGSEELDEVVGVGYGTQNLKKLIGSVVQIFSGDIEDRPIIQYFTESMSAQAFCF